jgi:ribonucleotide monophosphatase NagD (HAD superfamily)
MISSSSAVFQCGISFLQDEIIFPTLVAASYLKEQNLKKKAYILASSAVKEIFKANEIMCSNDVGVSILFLPFFILILFIDYVSLLHSAFDLKCK